MIANTIPNISSILLNCWIFLVPIFSLGTLFIKAEVLFRVLLPYLPKHTALFVLRYVEFVYLTNWVYYLNLVHIFLFTLGGFILRFTLIEDYSWLSDYRAYFIFYLIFGAAVRFCDTVLCFLYFNYRSKFGFFGFLKNYAHADLLYERIVMARVFKGVCTAFGICVTGVGTWLTYKRYKKENYAECSRAEAQLWDQWADKEFDWKTYRQKWAELYKKHGINRNNKKDFERYKEQNFAEYSRLRDELDMQWFNNVINAKTHAERLEELMKKHGITKFEENFREYKRRPRK